MRLWSRSGSLPDRRVTCCDSGLCFGRAHSTRVDVPKGDPRDPMTEEEIAVKFTALGGDIMGKEQCKKLQSFIMSMETAKDLDGLFELTTAQ